MKKRKLKLHDLAVESFITNLSTEVEETIKGGITTVPTYVIQSIHNSCPSNPVICDPGDDTLLSICATCGPEPGTVLLSDGC